jgi:hypothetical protein
MRLRLNRARRHLDHEVSSLATSSADPTIGAFRLPSPICPMIRRNVRGSRLSVVIASTLLNVMFSRNGRVRPLRIATNQCPLELEKRARVL